MALWDSYAATQDKMNIEHWLMMQKKNSWGWENSSYVSAASAMKMNVIANLQGRQSYTKLGVQFSQAVIVLVLLP